MTYILRGPVSEHVKRAVRGYYIGVAEWGGINKWPCIIQEVIPNKSTCQYYRLKEGVNGDFDGEGNENDVPPVAASAFPKVCSLANTRSSNPRRATLPRPWGPYIPVEWASSTTRYAFLRGKTSSNKSTISCKGANVPSILYKLSTAKNKLFLPDLNPPLSWFKPISIFRRSLRELWVKENCAFRAREALTPSCTEAWIYSSQTTTSPVCGMQEKKPTLASNPELKSRAVSALKNWHNRASNAACARPLTKRRDPPEPRTSGASKSFLRKWSRRTDDWERDR